MTDAPLMVGVSGLRGIAGRSLTEDVARQYAGGFANWLLDRGAARRIVVARDGRSGGGSFLSAITEVFSGAGFEVADLGVAMTPTVGVMTDRLSAAAAMIVTASHNPQEWNGLKCLVRGGEADLADAAAPSAALAQEIVNCFRERRLAPTGRAGEVRGVGDAAAVHVAKVTEALAAVGAFGETPPRRRRVVLDSVNASGVEGGRRLLAHALGCELIHQGDSDSGIFPHAPEPTRENLVDLCKTVSRFSAEVGFAQDPDADRLAVIDETGRYIGEEYTLALAAEALLSCSGPKGRERVLVTNLSTSRMIDDVAARHSARVLRTPVGEANVVEVMKREALRGAEVVVGGEGNGGVIWPRVTYVRDSLSAMSLVLSLLARRGKTLGEIVADMPRYAIEKRKVDLASRDDADPAVAKLTAAYREHTVDMQDGVRIDFASGPLARRAWLHVRASNTEPIMRLIAEAPTDEDARRVLDEAARVIAAG
jgi:phosphomannomutase